MRQQMIRALLTAPIALALIAQQPGDLDMSKVQEIRAKQRRKEALTVEEEAYARRAAEWQRQRMETFRKDNPPRESMGFTPLSEFSGEYKGQQGGLYPGGASVPPKAHWDAGLAIAGKIRPIEPGGKIVLLSMGMSNTTQEFQVFQKLAGGTAGLNPHLLIVDGAQGGQSAEVTANPQADYWKVVEERLAAAGASANHVQIIWMKQAIQVPSRPFPEETKRLQKHLEANLHILQSRFPNVKIAYLSNRIYAGYATTPLNPEPHAYESGFAVKWLIADQIAGKPELNYDPRKGAVRSPWLAWGPDLWADGVRVRKDGLTYQKEDLAADGTHPSMSGREKVAGLLLGFLQREPTAQPWFLAQRQSSGR